MADYEESDVKKELIGSGVKPPSPTYGSSSSTSSEGDAKPSPSVDSDAPLHSRNKVMSFLYVHREKIPGYGMLRLARNAGPYALYVLFALLITYFFNQLDRYTLPIVTTTVGAELHYGDKSCRVHPGVNTDILLNSTCYQEDLALNVTCSNLTDYCSVDNVNNKFKNKDFKGTKDLCLSNYTSYFYNSGNTSYACQWWWDGSGLAYQILAGPVFNNLYVLAGIFAGFLADIWNRKVFLVISLVIWSVATGLTGLAQEYWHLVVLRALLAIGAAGCSPFAVSILSDYIPKELRGSAMGIYYLGIYLGYSLAFAIGNGITVALGWRWVFYICGLAGIVYAPILLITVKEPERKRNIDVEKSTSPKDKISAGQKIVLLFKTFFMPGMFMLCIAAGIRNAGGYVWAYNTEVFFETVYSLDRIQISKFMSWIPLVGGSLGAIVGGLISDLLVKNRGTYARIWVIIVSQFLAAPFAAGALFLPYPWCFISLIPSNIIGEMWIGVSTAIIVDLVPSKIRTTSIAVYLFIITVIGGNFNLLVPPLQQGFEKQMSDAASYRWSLFLTFPGLYALSAILFIFTFFLMRVDLHRKKKMEEYLLVNSTDEEEGEEERDEKKND